ncbi:hypothetical protein QAD02_011189 [Eretmocerus hayati]|uniref:Uncharacterized protein n=1 Tax=Eretmocerus hayati TaxID=131215 RepID=A0ACC2NX24_9HYME|nr:hypothetical protein QAD02_011189 [Eretmocerus hayati]
MECEEELWVEGSPNGLDGAAEDAEKFEKELAQKQDEEKTGANLVDVATQTQSTLETETNIQQNEEVVAGTSDTNRSERLSSLLSDDDDDDDSEDEPQIVFQDLSNVPFQSEFMREREKLYARLGLSIEPVGGWKRSCSWLASCDAQIYTGGAPIASTATSSNADTSSSVIVAEPQQPISPEFTTQTVYGFLDFTTTMGNTVMVFSPQSAPAEGTREAKSKDLNPIETKPTIEKKKTEIQPSKTHKVDESKSSSSSSSNNSKKDKKIIVNSVVEQNVVSQSDDSTHEKTTEKIAEAVTKSQTVEKEQQETSSEPAELRTNDDVPGVKNNLAEPEYDFLSRQPTEVVDENYKVINLRPSNGKSSSSKPRPSPARPNKENPTGLVTKLGGTIVKDGLTTVHETSVIGTYINGKYAQVLQSSSTVLNEPDQQQLQPQPSNIEANRIRPSGTQRILKTIGPQGKLKQQQQQLEPTSPSQNDENHEFGAGGNRAGRQRATGQLRPKFRKQNVPDEASNNADNNAELAQQQQQQHQQQQKSNGGNGNGKNRPNGTARPGYKNRVQTTPSSPAASEPTSRRRINSKDGGGFRPSNSAGNPTKQYKNSKSENNSPLSTSNPLVKSKLPRTQGRWAYKSTPKPRIQIRKQPGGNNAANNAVTSGLGDDQQLPPGVSTEQSVVVASQPELESGSGGQQRREAVDFDGELEEGESEDPPNVSVPQINQGAEGEGEGQVQKPTPTRIPLETLNVEISTPADVNDIYFEIATIKSPYEFQVGSTRNTRFVTVTSTIKKSFATADPASSSSVSPTEPLTENILANTGAAYESSLPLDSSIATLPAITLEPSQATPPLETITETFSTTQTLLKTHLLPVVVAGGNSTSRITLVQTYNVARIVTATKTLPPPEIYQFVPSKTLNEFNSKLDEAGSELHLELDFGDDENDDEDVPKRIVAPSSDLDADLLKGLSPTNRHRGAHPSATSSGSVPVPAEPAMTQEQMQQLALLKLLGQTPQVITTSKPVIKLETVWDTHVIPLVNAGNTIFSTLSRPIATVTRTSYEYGTSTLAPIVPPQPLLPQVPAAPLPLFPQAAPQFTVTSQPLVQQTIATVSDSRVLKLTFGAKTAYTTLYSTRLVPTEITTFVTSTLAVQPTVAAYPGFFPPAAVGYPGYPYVG